MADNLTVNGTSLHVWRELAQNIGCDLEELLSMPAIEVVRRQRLAIESRRRKELLADALKR